MIVDENRIQDRINTYENVYGDLGIDFVDAFIVRAFDNEIIFALCFTIQWLIGDKPNADIFGIFNFNLLANFIGFCVLECERLVVIAINDFVDDFFRRLD